MSNEISDVSDSTEKLIEDIQDAIKQLRAALSQAMIDAVDESFKRKPYAMLALALAVGIGFLLGATSRR